jgi:hypothetical protein
VQVANFKEISYHGHNRCLTDLIAGVERCQEIAREWSLGVLIDPRGPSMRLPSSVFDGQAHPYSSSFNQSAIPE